MRPSSSSVFRARSVETIRSADTRRFSNPISASQDCSVRNIPCVRPSQTSLSVE